MHKYAVQLIRSRVNPETLRPVETIELEKIVDTFHEAMHWAFQYGARKRKAGDELPKIENTRAVYPCKDKRFARVQIIIKA